MESDGHRLYEGAVSCRYAFHGYYLLPRQCDVLPHRTVALHSERLVVLARVHPSVAACGTLSAVGVRVDGDSHAGLQRVGASFAHRLDDGSYLVSRYDILLRHCVAAEESVEVRAAEAHIFEFQEHLSCLCCWFFHLHHLHVLWRGYRYCFHSFVIIVICHSLMLGM